MGLGTAELIFLAIVATILLGVLGLIITVALVAAYSKKDDDE
ncbi:MAG: hypothetical protein SNJ75_18170 [Gemmataceae bacterium]